MEQKIRRVERLVEPVQVLEGAGVRLKRSIASRKLDYLDPFLLFDHFGSDNPDDFLAGFPMHPHRGIETVTYMMAGFVDHMDSLGNAGRIGPGDVQWMTAGSGIMHEEMPKPDRGGRMEGFQLWVNLPARLKMSRPRYQEFAAEHIPDVEVRGARVRVVAGQVDGVDGPVREIAARPTYLDVTVLPGEVWTHPVPRGHNAFAYLFEGQGALGRSEAPLTAPLLAVLGDGDRVEVAAGADPVRFLLVSGEPLGEPVARYGPFVMNTRAEIEQALRDLRAGTFVKVEPEAPEDDVSEDGVWYGSALKQ
ncbi:MAG: pirin family protein [Anaerolineae bacterium]|jgi:redox-sensitive bicupin YhaK (pirin superfamily)